MAPEQLEGEGVGPAVDVYALAAVAFEALSGRKARTGATPVQVAHAIATEPPPDLMAVWPAATAEAAAALSRAMARDPAGRPTSAGELARELADGLDLAAAGGGEAPAPAGAAAPPLRPPPPSTGGERARGPVTRHGRSARRRSLGAIAGAVAIAIAVGAVLVVLLSEGGSERQPAGGRQAARK